MPLFGVTFPSGIGRILALFAHEQGSQGTTACSSPGRKFVLSNPNWNFTTAETPFIIDVYVMIVCNLGATNRTLACSNSPLVRIARLDLAHFRSHKQRDLTPDRPCSPNSWHKSPFVRFSDRQRPRPSCCAYDRKINSRTIGTWPKHSVGFTNRQHARWYLSRIDSAAP